MLGFVVQSSFGKYLLVQTKDKAGEDFHEDGTKHTHKQDQDYHDTGFPHTHGPDSLEDNAAQTVAAEAGQAYQRNVNQEPDSENTKLASSGIRQ